MALPIDLLTQRLLVAMHAVLPESVQESDPQVRRSQDRRFGDYQANAFMGIGKQLAIPPRAVAQRVLDACNLADLVEAADVAGPGFINFTMLPSVIEVAIEGLAGDRRLGVRQSPPGRDKVLIDYSAPNVAKEMHVGHLRSTILGDALVRVHEALGHVVIRQNHIGDWGTPFGMLIEHLVEIGEETAVAKLTVGDLTSFYQEARRKFDSDSAFAERARLRVVSLQQGDAVTRRLWQLLYDASREYFTTVYTALDVKLTDDDIVPESSYNDELESTLSELREKGLASLSDGAWCAFPAGFVSRDGTPMALIVQKSDGGFGYQATDLAALRGRARRLHATQVLYVVGQPQSVHLEMVFAVAKAAGWLENTKPEHVAFGSVLGDDGRMFKTRDGGSVRLIDLIDEARARASVEIGSRTANLLPDARRDLSTMVGVGAIKYADLSSDRIKDYTFDWDRMLSSDGNTGPYLQYANARIRSIFRRAAERGVRPADRIAIGPGERDLALQLLDFGEAVLSVAATSQPHKLCTYLFELAQTFSRYYENVPVLNAVSEIAESRLALCGLTGRVLEEGLDLLGIRSPDAM
ncbi:MAG: arginine--tRNA ligase [Acidimicrobiia bacterium]|nr:arginine--tRNA ligase [Acidimicrobiia bacterium]